MRYPQRKSFSNSLNKNKSHAEENISSSPESSDAECASTTSPKPPPSGARLRGLAFAMLGRREYSQQEFKQKLLDLEADPTEVDELVTEFQTSQYQSDQRMADMIVRANVRKGRGPVRVKQTLRERSVDAELVQDHLAETDWLALARALRVKKFGVELPTDQKEKARQLRFLQYRGFDMQTCSHAIGRNDIEEDQ
jgi:regulatory protein